MRENKLQAECIKDAKKIGAWAIKVKAIGRRGFPDLLVIFPGGQVIFVEMKIKGGRLSPSQRIVIRMLRKFGVPTYVCDNQPEFNEILRRHIR